MKRFFPALVVALLAATTARAHFIWIVPGPAGGDKVQVVFSDTLQPDDAELLKKIGHTEVFIRSADGKTVPAKWTLGKDAYEIDVPGQGPRVVGAACRYGVIQRGQGEPFLLHYNARAHVGRPRPDAPEQRAVFHKGWDRLGLDIVLVEKASGEGRPGVQVLWQGKPLPAAELVLIVPGVEKPVEIKANADGIAAVELPRASSLYGIRARHIDKKEGELEGKKYKEVRHYATLVARVEGDGKQPAAPAEKPAALPADPAATKLLADARAARAQWENFHGFSADLEVYADGKTSKGKVEVSAKGQVSVKLDEPAVEPWIRRTLGSIVGHRIDNSAALDTPCAFTDGEMDHPLGRAIRVLNDELHSSYRVRDRQIIVVNRHMGDVRFTITVMENRLNEEKKFLPSSYVVNSWDLKTDALKSSETHHHTWTRVGKYDLPSTTTVVKASAGQQESAQLEAVEPQVAAVNRSPTVPES